jgi:hypothetical protein
MSETALMIAVSDIRSSCAGEPDIMERLRKAMRKAQHFWMSTDDDLRFRGAVGAAMLESSPEEQERIKRSVQSLRSFSAMLSGVPVDTDAMIAQMGDDNIPLIAMWNEAKATCP